MKRPGFRTLTRWALRGLLPLAVLFGVYVGFLAFPHPLFAHGHRYGEFAVRSTHPLPADFGRVIDDARTRIEAMEHARPGRGLRVFVCGNERLYSLFPTLTGRGTDSMALGLSVFGNVFLNETKIRRVAAGNHGGIRHCRFEGSLAEAIAHEVAHFNVVDTLGYRAAVRMPFWKSEGYAEYQANLAAVRADSTYDFADRIERLLDDAFWRDSDVARRLFEWHLLVEYLAEVQDMGLEDLADAKVTEDHSREQMLRWFREQPPF